MRIISIIWKKFKTLIVFLLLELIALYMVFSLNIYQNSYIFQATTSLRTNLFTSFSLIDDYLNLDAKNKQLINENTRLIAYIKNSNAHALTKKEVISEQYNYIPAKVTYSSIGLPENYLVLNQGKRNGVKPEMAVVSANGLVGIVYAVTNDYASVLPLINTNFSCLVSVSDYTLSASTSWDGRDYRYTTVKGVPLHLTIKKNDSIFTNNNSTLYPSNELIGTVESVEKEDLGKSFALRVKLATDFSTLKHVYIVENMDKSQIDSLLYNE